MTRTHESQNSEISIGTLFNGRDDEFTALKWLWHEAYRSSLTDKRWLKHSILADDDGYVLESFVDSLSGDVITREVKTTIPPGGLTCHRSKFALIRKRLST